MSKANKTGRTKNGLPHVRLHHWLLQSVAWSDLSANARALYVELAYRYRGTNNGRISLSVREAADRLRIGKDTAARAFAELQDAGFIKVTRQGFFHGPTRQATLWELTEYGVDGALPTKDFMRPKIHSSVSPQGQTVSPQGQDSLISGTVRFHNQRFGT